MAAPALDRAFGKARARKRDEVLAGGADRRLGCVLDAHRLAALQVPARQVRGVASVEANVLGGSAVAVADDESVAGGQQLERREINRRGVAPHKLRHPMPTPRPSSQRDRARPRLIPEDQRVVGSVPDAWHSAVLEALEPNMAVGGKLLELVLVSRRAPGRMLQGGEGTASDLATGFGCSPVAQPQRRVGDAVEVARENRAEIALEQVRD